MRNWIIKYSLEIFSALVIIFVMINILFFPEINYIQKLTLTFALVAVLHEFEEKRYPGGFFDLMVKKFGLSTEKTNVDLASFFVICYWVVLISLSYIFDNMVMFLIMSVSLGIFETFIHTAGIWLHKMKKPYTPGLISAWIMGLLSGYSIYYLNVNNLAIGKDYLFGTILMVIGFIILQRGTLYAANMTYRDIKENIKKNFSSK